jgi:ribonucleases P/MRP protein subunit RPP40
LGPLLFVIFINDLVNRLSCPCLLYADDLKVYTSIKSSSDYATLQKDLNTVSDWCSINRMSLNVTKCCVISFTKKKNRVVHSYFIRDKTLKRCDIIKDLGIYFDQGLTFRTHYGNILRRSSRMLGFLRL